MAFGADHMQTASGHHLLMPHLPRPAGGFAVGFAGIGRQRLQLGLQITAQDNVGATSSHIGGNRHRAGPPGLSDDFGFPLVLLGVEDFMGNLVLFQQLGQQFRNFNRSGADQGGLTALAAVADVVQHRLEFFRRGEEHQIAHILADHRQMRRRHQHFQPINLLELEGFRVGSAGHPGQFLIQTEIVLEGNRGQGLVFSLNRHSLLGFNGLMQPIRPAPSRHGAPGELIHDDNFVFANDVFHIAVKQSMRPQTGVQMMKHAQIGGVVQALAGA